jgi:predicted alpha/beta-hydrolase family hydrolase
MHSGAQVAGPTPPYEDPAFLGLLIERPTRQTTTAAWWNTSTDRPAVVLAHGGRRREGVSVQGVLERQVGGIARELAERGHGVLAFNFPYGERGIRRPDDVRALEEAFTAAVVLAREMMPQVPLVFGGRSMGARVASLVAANGVPNAGLALLGYPLHPRGVPDQPRTGHWASLEGDVLFVHGEFDHLCGTDELDAELRHLRPQARVTQHVIAGANHLFRVPDREPSDVQRQVGRAIAEWIENISSIESDRLSQSHST